MSQDAMVTEEEARRREREAFEQGACWLKVEMLNKRPTAGWLCPPEFEHEAKRRYPIKRKVPRTVEVDGLRAEPATAGHAVWIKGRGGNVVCVLSAEGVANLSDLLANPYEEVDE